MKLFRILLLGAPLLPFQVYAMDTPDDLIEHVYDHKVTYSPGIFNYYRDDKTLSVLPRSPQKVWNQALLTYDRKYDHCRQEIVLGLIIPGKDGRERISKTAEWPNSIHTQLSMIFKGNTAGYGSGTMVGPHHLLTCGHNVYNHKLGWAEEILVYPALNGKVAPFGCAKVTKAYTFWNWQHREDNQFDMALLILDQPIGDYTGWGGLLNAPEAELLQEKVNITGYPGDNGVPRDNVDKNCTQMWSMSHKIKNMSSEQFHYEIDTYAGQSGSAIWINKWGMPIILGVHTSGSKNINIGVRLSRKKFTDLVLKIMPTTYVLNNNKENSLSIVSNLTPQIKPSSGSQKQEEFAIRGSMIDDCINQYKVLVASNLTHLQFHEVCKQLHPQYAKRQSMNTEKGLEDKECENILNEGYMKKEGIQLILEIHKASAHYPQQPASLNAFGVIGALKIDVIEGMELYRKLYGRLHPRWEEFSKLIPEISALNKTPILTNSSLTQKVQPSFTSPQEKREIFAIQGAMIDECINQYKKIINTSITSTELMKILDFFIDTYTARVEHAKKLHSEMHKFLLLGSLKTTEVIRLANALKGGAIGFLPRSSRAPHIQHGEKRISLGFIQRVSSSIREGVLESMELYKEVYGEQHPRWDEFSKM